MRHGESAWNATDRFTGGVDVVLTPRGRAEASATGRWLADAGIRVTQVYSSVLRRAADTADLLLEAAGQPTLPVVRTDVLNERHYGALQGMTRAAAVETYGPHRVAAWRRSIDGRPPPDDAGCSETLAEVRDRLAPFVRDAVVPGLAAGHTVLVVSHGNTIRMLVQLVEGLSDEQACGLELPTGRARVLRCERPASGTPRRFAGISLIRPGRGSR